MKPFTTITRGITGKAPGIKAVAARMTGGIPHAVECGLGTIALPIAVLGLFGLYEQTPPPGTGQQQPPANPPQTPPPAALQFTAEQQAEINRIAAQARDEGRRSGMTEAEKKAADEKAAADNKALADQQQFRPLYETEQAAHNATKASFKQAAIRTAIRMAATEAGFHDPDMAASLLDLGAAQVDENTWAVANAAEMVRTLATSKPFLVKAAGDGQGAGGGGQQGGQGGGNGQRQGGSGYGPYRGQAQPVPGTPNAQGVPPAPQGEQMSPERRAAIDAQKAELRRSGRYG
jgi:hypothetical protein